MSRSIEAPPSWWSSAGGELDAYAAPDLSQAFTSVAGEDRIVVDLETVSFLDSTALGVVVKAIREVDERRGRSVIVLPAGPARRIFEITTLDRVLAVAPSSRTTRWPRSRG